MQWTDELEARMRANESARTGRERPSYPYRPRAKGTNVELIKPRTKWRTVGQELIALVVVFSVAFTAVTFAAWWTR